MQDEIVNYLKDKKIVILGFGREGKSTYNFLRKHFEEKEIDVIDENIDINSEENREYLEDMNLNVIKTSEYINMLNAYDLIFKTPGISFKGIDISSFANKITSQLDIFLKYFKEYVTIIGITGTKGKSTTSSMLYQVLNKAKNGVHFLGNIGRSIFCEIDEIKKGDTVVLEISSHQSQYIKNSPNIGVILNVFQEHLDHYNSYEEYIDAKINVIKFQAKEDYAIYIKNSSDLNKRLENVKLNSKIINLDLNDKDKFSYFNFEHKRRLIGKHNEYNIMVVLKICEILKVEKNIVCEEIYNFSPLEHRLENVGQYDGVFYYNDSISTIPETAIACVNTIGDVDTLIIGGLDRGIDYTNFEKFLIDSKLVNIICMYDTGRKIFDNIVGKTNKNVILVKDIYEAVECAKKVTKKGRACAMSPAAASYGFFKNFEERGRIFKELVKRK